jgi:hypothetical protein
LPFLIKRGLLVGKLLPQRLLCLLFTLRLLSLASSLLGSTLFRCGTLTLRFRLLAFSLRSLFLSSKQSMRVR